MKNCVILGSTGSVGVNAIKVSLELKDELKVYALTCNSNVELISQQAHKTKPKYVYVANKSNDVIDVPSTTKVLNSIEELNDIVVLDEVDIVFCAVVGTSALNTVLAAIRAKKDIALASKELMVIAGRIIMQEARKHKVRIIPVDSEHNAIFQCLQARDLVCLNNLYLTCSGGPFYHKDAKELEQVSVKDALQHPVWSMGKKISIDSASLMNKALEIIEAYHLFNVSEDRIKVLFHPQGIIHSLVSYKDGSFIAQLSTSDMCFPIQYALTYPACYKPVVKELIFDKMMNLSLQELDYNRFYSIKKAYEILNEAESFACVFNKSNEVAVEKFLNNEISFTQIYSLIDYCLENHSIVEEICEDAITLVEQETKILAASFMQRI